MRRARSLVPLVLLLAACRGGPPRAPEPLAAEVEFARVVEQRAPALLAEHWVPGIAVALVQNGRVAWTKGFGRRDVWRGGRVSASTVFEADPLARPMAAWALLRLAQAGEVELDTPVARYLGPAVGPDTLTVRHLLDGPDQGLALERRLVQRLAGEPFADYMREEILEPLGLRSTAFVWRREFRKRVATGYSTRGRLLEEELVTARPDAELFTTVQDVSRWLLAGLPGRRPAAIRGEVLDAPAVQGLLSLGGDTLSNGVWYITRGGSAPGWTAWLAAIPERGAGIVILANSGEAEVVVQELFCPWAESAGGGRPASCAQARAAGR
jgi:CubicO group peptidase (beta-lactamase class C family)